MYKIYVALIFIAALLVIGLVVGIYSPSESSAVGEVKLYVTERNAQETMSNSGEVSLEVVPKEVS